MSAIRLPWQFCNGWWSPWCVLDLALRCKVPAVCQRHDAVQIKAFDRALAEAPPVQVNWTGPSNPFISTSISTSTTTNLRWWTK